MPLLVLHLTKGQADPKVDQMSSWPDIVLLLATRCLYQGGTSELSSTGPNLVSLLAMRCLYWGSIWLKCKKDIWKFENTLHFRCCFTEVFSMKDQQVVLTRKNCFKSLESPCSQVSGCANHNGGDQKFVWPTICEIKFVSCWIMGILQKLPSCWASPPISHPTPSFCPPDDIWSLSKKISLTFP